MRKIKIRNFIGFRWFFWLLLVILWNFGYPQATPLQDVIIAVILSLVFIFFKNKID